MGAAADRELKLGAAPDFAMPDFPGEPLPERSFTATYLDTPDLRLARTGVTLRRRVENGSAEWQLKLPRGRRRVEVDLPGDRDDAVAELAALLFAHTRGQDVATIAAVRTTRGGIAVHDGDRHVADVIASRVELLEDDAVTGEANDLEIELVDGDGEALADIAARLRDAGATDVDGRSKLQRALDLAPAPGPADADDDPGPAERLQAVVAAQYRAILANDPGTRLGTDIEHLHQHRVAVRRLRSVLRAAAPMLDGAWTRTLRDELKWAAAALGPVRDLDVMIGHLLAEIATLPEPEPAQPLVTALERERDRARDHMLEALRAQRYLELLATLEQASLSLPVTDPDVSLRKLARKEYRKVRKAMKALGPLPTDDALHESRIKVKRLRYTAELAAPFGGEALAQLVAETRKVQDLLGDHQDAHVAEERIRSLLSSALADDTQRAADRLIERERIRRRTIRRELPAAWAALDNAGAEAFA